MADVQNRINNGMQRPVGDPFADSGIRKNFWNKQSQPITEFFLLPVALPAAHRMHLRCDKIQGKVHRTRANTSPNDVNRLLTFCSQSSLSINASLEKVLLTMLRNATEVHR